MWYAVHTYTASLHLSTNFLNFSVKELSTTGANFRNFSSFQVAFLSTKNFWFELAEISSNEWNNILRNVQSFKMEFPFHFGFLSEVSREFSNGSFFGNSSISGRFSKTFPREYCSFLPVRDFSELLVEWKAPLVCPSF